VPVKPEHDRIRDAFHQDSLARSYAQSYLARLLDNIDATAVRLRRTVGEVVLLVAVFFLVSGARTTGFQLGARSASM
jgi:hypothetical protein